MTDVGKANLKVWMLAGLVTLVISTMSLAFGTFIAIRSEMRHEFQTKHDADVFRTAVLEWMTKVNDDGVKRDAIQLDTAKTLREVQTQANRTGDTVTFIWEEVKQMRADRHK